MIDAKQAVANIDPNELEQLRALSRRFGPDLWERVTNLLLANGLTEREVDDLVSEFRQDG